MMDLLTNIEKLYALRAYALSRRFIFLTITLSMMTMYCFISFDKIVGNHAPIAMLVALVIAGALWISGACLLPHEKRWLKCTAELIKQCQFELAEQKLASSPLLAGFALHIRRLEQCVRLKIEIGDLAAAYHLMTAVDAGILLPDERNSVCLTNAELLLRAGNYAAFRTMLARFSNHKCESKTLHFKHLLLMCRQHELDGNFGTAKALLEEAAGITSDQELAIVATNNLARLEDIQGNHNNAQNYYERAWLLLQETPVPSLYPVVIHNLLLKYAHQGSKDKALRLLENYRESVSLENIHQYNQFINDQIHLARQLGDYALLQDAYNRAENELKPLLNKQQRLASDVRGLRMSFNDNIDFSEHLAKTFDLIDKHKDLSLPERFVALIELLSVLDQYNTSQEDEKINEAISRIISNLLEIESEIDVQLLDVPAILPIVRDTWYGYRIQICKLKMRQSKGVFRSNLDSLFRLLQERRRVWADKGNAEGEIKTLVVYCDEYVAIARVLDPQFGIDYHDTAEQALADAEQLLKKHWPHPSMHQYAMGIAYFLLKISGDREKAAFWLEKFESLGNSPLHYAVWFRSQYVELKTVLGQSL